MLIPNTMQPRISLCPYFATILVIPSLFLCILTLIYPLFLLPNFHKLSHIQCLFSCNLAFHYLAKMSSICLDQQKFHQLLSPKRTIDIPPRKLFTHANTDMFSPEDLHIMHKFLPYNGVDNDDSDQFSSDHFRMYEFKVRRCTRSRSHDWTDCPFAHPGEKARRRDPRKYHYSGVMCADYRRGSCSRGDNCEFAHGVFECWLHPSRYRTEACKDGKHCKRKVCFFAHSARELRVLPVQRSDVSAVVDGRKYGKLGGHKCCMFSPTSTLVGLSHISPSQSNSPPFSPIEDHPGNGFSRMSRFGSKCSSCDSSKMSRVNCYKDMLTELMTDLEAMNMSEHSPLSYTKNNRNVPWINLPLTEDDTQFILSPSTPRRCGTTSFFKGDSPTSTGGSGNFFDANCGSNGFLVDNYKPVQENCPSSADPDFGWVNELLM